MERYISSASHVPLCAVPEGISVDVVGSTICYGPQDTWEVVLQIPVSDYDPINTEIFSSTSSSKFTCSQSTTALDVSQNYTGCTYLEPLHQY